VTVPGRLHGEQAHRKYQGYGQQSRSEACFHLKFCKSRNPWMRRATNRCKFKFSHLQNVALTRHQFVQNRIHEKSKNQPRD
jgi:hypothetical protein